MFTSKELYIMNGGNKTYIGKDGFWDIYNATPAEEAEWAQEVIAAALEKVNNEENPVALQFAIQNLKFLKYEGWRELITSKIPDASVARQKVFTDALAGITRY